MRSIKQKERKNKIKMSRVIKKIYMKREKKKYKKYKENEI